MTVDVMIVDDSAGIRKILRRMLEHAGITLGQIVEAEDGAQALEKLKQQPINLVLSDVNMPNMDGIQLLTELKANPESKHIPVIMITTEGGEAKVKEAIQLGASGYVRKPFTSEQIKDNLVRLFSSKILV